MRNQEKWQAEREAYGTLTADLYRRVRSELPHGGITAIADALGVPPSYVGNVIRGRQRSFPLARRIEAYLNEINPADRA